MSLASRAPLKIARAGQREGAHLVSRGIPLPASATHAVDEYLAVARALGAVVDPIDFALKPPADARWSVTQLLEAQRVSSDRPLIVVSPSAAQRWKQWPEERWSQVLLALADLGNVVVIGTSPQAQLHRRIVEGARRRPIDLTGQTTLAEAMALIERAALHVAPDTGTVHMAVALGTPVVAIYGPTPVIRVGPYRQPESVLGNANLCGFGCPAYCVFGRRCLRAVAAADVIACAEEALNKPVGQMPTGVP